MSVVRPFVGSELSSIQQSISHIKNMVPSGIRLKPSERRSLFKLNSKRFEFVHHAMENMRKNPSTVPAYIDIAGCNTQLHVYQQYTEILEQLQQLIAQVEDVRLMAGNEIMNQTRAYFHNTRLASETGLEQFEEIYNKLKPHYAVGRNSTKKV